MKNVNESLIKSPKNNTVIKNLIKIILKYSTVKIRAYNLYCIKTEYLQSILNIIIK